MFSEDLSCSTPSQIAQIIFVSSHEEAAAHAKINTSGYHYPNLNLEFVKYVALGSPVTSVDETKIRNLVASHASGRDPNVPLQVVDALPTTEEGNTSSRRLDALIRENKHVTLTSHDVFEGSCWTERKQLIEGSPQFSKAQVEVLHAQGIRPEKIPHNLVMAVVNSGEGQMLARNLDTRAAVCWSAPTDETVVVSTLREAIAHAQEHPERLASYIATGRTMSREGAEAVTRWVNLNAGECQLALPSSSRGHKDAWLISEMLGKEKNCERVLPSNGKTWADQARRNNPELVKSAPAKYRDLDLDR